MERFSGSLSDYENNFQEVCKYKHEINRFCYSEQHLNTQSEHTLILNNNTCTVTVNKIGEQWSQMVSNIWQLFLKTTSDLVISLINKTQNPVIRGKKKVTDFHISSCGYTKPSNMFKLEQHVRKKTMNSIIYYLLFIWSISW